MRRLTTALLLLGLATPAAAQMNRPRTPSDASVRRAVASITEADVRRRIGVLAHDSMRGRNTPSPELEQTAEWIASEFRRFGLRPGGDNGTFIQRYTIRRTQLDTTSFVMAMGSGAHGHWLIGRDAAFLGSVGGEAAGEARGALYVMAGTPTDSARPFGTADLRGAFVVYALGSSPAAIERLVGPLQAAGVRGLILTSDQLAARAAFSRRPQDQLGGSAGPASSGMPIFAVRDSAAAAVLQGAGIDLAQLKAGDWTLRQLPGYTGAMNIRRTVLSEASAPNVIGILEGSDPQLRNEYVFYTAHMDHVGVGRAVNGDSIYNGADDDASGTTGVIELAEAFSMLNPRPRRSIVFMTVSGEEKGLWGSEYYSEHPTLPLANTVANLNLDMIGRNWTDTISVIGKEHSSLGPLADRITREHPELNMNLVDDLWPNENFYRRSDHYNFARKGVPILFFFNGTHPQYHRPSDHVELIDAEKEARIVRMVFYIGLEVANTTERPQWNPESYRSIVQQATP